jgi:hypothetical protein
MARRTAAQIQHCPPLELGERTYLGDLLGRGIESGGSEHVRVQRFPERLICKPFFHTAPPLFEKKGNRALSAFIFSDIRASTTKTKSPPLVLRQRRAYEFLWYFIRLFHVLHRCDAAIAIARTAQGAIRTGFGGCFDPAYFVRWFIPFSRKCSQ